MRKHKAITVEEETILIRTFHITKFNNLVKSVIIPLEQKNKIPIELNYYYRLHLTIRKITNKNKVKIKRKKIYAKLVSLGVKFKGSKFFSDYYFRQIDPKIHETVSFIAVKLS